MSETPAVQGKRASSLRSGRLGFVGAVTCLALVAGPAVGAGAAVAPSGSAVEVSVNSASPVSTDGWYHDPVVLALGGPADATVQARVNSGAWRTNARNVTVSANGTATVEYRLLRNDVVVDGSSGQTVVKLDRSAPKVALTRSPSGSGTPRNPVRVDVTGTDVLAGVSRLEYRVNGADWSVVPEGGLTFDQVGRFAVSARAVDKAGNTSTERSTVVVISEDPITTGSVWPLSGTKGTPVTIVVRGFDRFDEVTLASDGAVWGTVRTDVNGLGKVTVSVPEGISPWASEIVAVGSDPGVYVIVPFTLR